MKDLIIFCSLFVTDISDKYIIIKIDGQDREQ